MNTPVTIKMELDINAQKLMSHYRTYSDQMDQMVEEGVKSAIQNLSNDKTLEELVRESIEKSVVSAIQAELHSYQLRSKIAEALNKKVGEQIEAYTDNIAEAFKKQINAPQ